VAGITAEDAREALIEFASNKCCYGTKAAKNMDIKDMQASSAFHVSM
jgi:hypothetical protein